MLKIFFQALLVMSFVTSAYAQSDDIENSDMDVETSTLDAETVAPQMDQFSKYVMKGFNAGLEYSSIGADTRVSFSNSSLIKSTYTTNTNENAGALGASINYANLPRSRFGYMVGLGIVSKIDNEQNTTSSLKSSKNFTQYRPEANVGYAFSNGIWGMIGAHVSYMKDGGSMADVIVPWGGGLQTSVGYVPTKHFGLDLGYYLTMHSFSSTFVNTMASLGQTVNESDSWVRFSQIRARATFYF